MMKQIIALSLFLLTTASVIAQRQPDSQRVVQGERVFVIPCTESQRMDTTIYDLPETMPVFVGGEEAWKNYLRANAHYTDSARSNHVTGTVYVSFIVEKNGTVTYPQLRRGIRNSCGLNEEALRVISQSPPWNPGKLNGCEVRTKLTVPLRFVLPD